MSAAEDAVKEKMKKPEVPQPDDIIMKKIQKAMEQLDELDKKSASINADRRSIIERLESEGINRFAFKAVRQRMGMKASKKEGFDLTYILCRSAVGDALQTNWLDDQAD